MEFNNDQKAAIRRAVDGFLEKDLPGLTIIGEGGTGKTTCVMDIAAQLIKAGLKVLFTAPTNKAVKQLEKSAKRYGLTLNNVAFQTLHSALGLALLPSEENKYAHRLGRGVFPIFDVVVVDEASMLGKRVLFDYLLPDAKEHNCKLLLMGDDMQLPPVKEKESLAFKVFDTVRLTQVERQAADSNILTLSGLLRTAMANNKPFFSPAIQGNGVEVIKSADFLKEVVKAFDKDTDLDEQRVLAWSNARVDEINSAIRQKLFGRGAPRFVEGERVVTGAPITDGETVLLSTDEECIVHRITESSIEDEETGDIYRTLMLVLNPIHADIGQVFAHVLDDRETDRYWDRLNHLASMAKKHPQEARMFWAKYHDFKDLFASIRYCYCITVHRSQGSTFRRAFVDLNNILKNNIRAERQRLVYVAFSRPSHELLLNKGKYVA